jgi:uncharacterized membrane protein/protein-disulfide isomerase
MATRLLLVVLRVALLVALVASTALFLDYAQGAPAFCGGGGGCAAVRASAFSHVAGVGLPTIGLVAFAILFAAALAVSKRLHAKLLAALLAVAAVCAAGLIATQLFVVHAVCPWCMVVDSSAIVAAVTAWALARREPDAEPWPLRFGWFVAGVVAIVAPWSWGGAPVVTVELPQPLAALQHEGVTDIVMFTDFQCPYCRKLHAEIHARLAAQPEKFKLVRYMAPLPFHKAADPAARAYVCAPEPKREAMADKLYTADFSGMIGEEERPAAVIQTVVEDAVVALAAGIGIDRDAFVACMASEATKQKVEAEFAFYKSLALPGLPTTFVDDKRIVGADLKAFDQALGGSDLRTMFALLGVVFAGAAAASIFRSQPNGAGDSDETAAKSDASKT